MTKIIGKSIANAEQMATLLLSKNANPKLSRKIGIKDFCQLWLNVCAKEGVRGDIAFSQACKETGWFQFNGDVKYTQNNFAGLGATGGVVGCAFSSIEEGILAQAQHLKTYATKDALNEKCVDPRRSDWFISAKGGTSPDVETLGGTWAVPGYDTKKYASLQAANLAHDSYGYQIMTIVNQIISTKGGNTAMANKPKVCIDAGHYGKFNRCPAIPSYYESDMVWKLHLMQKKYLEQLGIEVVTTRANKDKDMDLVARGKASAGCDLFISDHSNAVGGGMNEATDYVAVYHLVEDTTTNVDDISKEIAYKIAPIIADVMGTKQGYKVLTRKAESDRNKDGMKNDNYYGVLHGSRLANTPGLIIEHSFHTNSRAVEWLLKDENLDKLAKAEAECIASYLLGKTVNAPVLPVTPSAPSSNKTSNIENGMVEAKKFTGKNETNISKMKAMVLQTALNKDYNSKLDVDGCIGSLTKKALGSHYVQRGEKQWMVTAAEILMLLNDINPNGVEYPGVYGNGLVKAAKQKFGGTGTKIDYKSFLALAK